MEEKTEVKTIELVRRIRDEQAKLLAGKSPEEIIEFFHQAGAAARKKTLPITRASQVANQRLQSDDLQPLVSDHR
jgi:hypothetical protein